MSFPRYPKYKPSGVQWLGEVPVHWEVLPGRRVFEQRRDPPRKDDAQLSSTQKFGVIPQSLFMEREDQKVVLALSGLDNFKHVEKNDFIISLRSFQGGIEHSAYAGCASPAYTVLRARNRVEPPYFARLLKCEPYIAALQSGTQGIRDGKNISYDEFGGILLPLPPLLEQRAIAAFLDRETATIDALVEEQRGLIGLLKEKRQALISHAVTKGLNPKAKLKDSGIEWLGMVPEGWEVKKLGFAAKLQGGFAFKADEFGDEGIPVIRMKNLSRGVLDLEVVARIPLASSNESVSLREGDLLLGMSGSIGDTGSLGNYAVVRAEDLPAQLNQRVGRFLPRENHVSMNFLCRIIQSSGFSEQILLEVTGTAQFNVSSSQVESCIIALPPLPEQLAIATFLDTETVKLDSLVAEAEGVIALLQERRSALISAAVTGGIDVRKT